MEYQLIYRAAEGCREIQKNLNSKATLLDWLRAFATEPIYRSTRVVSVHEIRKFGAYGNGRRSKKLDVVKLTREALSGDIPR